MLFNTNKYKVTLSVLEKDRRAYRKRDWEQGTGRVGEEKSWGGNDVNTRTPR